MKKHLLCCLSIFLFSFITFQTKASHGTGGELTWRCLGTGEYVFQLKFYRDCNGIPGPGSVTINTTVPGVPTIAAPMVSQTDISPDGYFSDGFTTCPTCAMGNGGSPIFGLIEEFIYESAPVTLNGVPPAGGWTFSWGECCRSSALTNISSAGGIGFLFQAKMYSYNGQNANPCFDASPFFAEKPNAIICTGLPIVYQHLSADPELDSLAYDFTNPLDEFGNSIPFAPGYSVQNPLADPVTLNTQTGEYSFLSATPGYFAMVIKVSSYKCGVLVAEIRREINVLITANCPPMLGGVNNLPPDVPAPFEDPLTGLFTSYADTVIAGDTVDFQINVVDFQQFTNGSTQTVTHNAFGQQYGTNFTDAASGCLIPPCATLSFPTPYTFPIALIQNFNWVTTPAHLGYSTSCVQFSNTYYFLNKATDNYCPANAGNTRVISITVMPSIPAPPLVNNGGNLECNLGPTYTYQWFLNRFAIPGATGSSYTPVQVGTYHVLAIAPDGQGNYSEGYYYNPVGIYENAALNSVSVYPNPSLDGIFSLAGNNNEITEINLTVFDIFGKTVFSDVIKQNSYKLDLSRHAAGMYTIDLNTNGMSRKIKLVR